MSLKCPDCGHPFCSSLATQQGQVNAMQHQFAKSMAAQQERDKFALLERAVERAEGSLNKAKAKVRIRLLKLAKDKLEEAVHLLHGSGATITFPGDEYGLDLADSIIAGIAAIRGEVGE